MDQTTDNPAKSTQASPAPSPLAGTMATHKSIAKIRPILTRNQSSFTRALTSITTSEKANLSLPNNLSNTTLDISTNTTIKNDINLVQEVHHESTPLVIPEIQTPLLTPLPIPNTKSAFIDAVTAESKKITWTKAGLQKYLVVIHSNEHTVFSPTFLSNQTESTTAAIEELDDLKVELESIITEVKGLVTPAVTPAVTPSISTSATPEKQTTNGMTEDYFTTPSVQDPVKNGFKEKFAALRVVIAKIRGVLVAAHVFYKINYALAADKVEMEKEE